MCISPLLALADCKPPTLSGVSAADSCVIASPSAPAFRAPTENGLLSAGFKAAAPAAVSETGARAGRKRTRGPLSTVCRVHHGVDISQYRASKFAVPSVGVLCIIKAFCIMQSRETISSVSFKRSLFLLCIALNAVVLKQSSDACCKHRMLRFCNCLFYCILNQFRIK